MLEPRTNANLRNTHFYTPPPTQNPGEMMFLAPQAPKLFLVWLLDQYSNLVRTNSGKILKKVISSKKADI